MKSLVLLVLSLIVFVARRIHLKRNAVKIVKTWRRGKVKYCSFEWKGRYYENGVISSYAKKLKRLKVVGYDVTEELWVLE